MSYLWYFLFAVIANENPAAGSLFLSLPTFDQIATRCLYLQFLSMHLFTDTERRKESA